jgi:hypothetical protein
MDDGYNDGATTATTDAAAKAAALTSVKTDTSRIHLRTIWDDADDLVYIIEDIHEEEGKYCFSLTMALVWFVDKFPRSRKPVQYRRLEDLVMTTGQGRGPPQLRRNDLLPVLLPCALCCAQQQMSTSVVANHLHKKRSESNTNIVREDGIIKQQKRPPPRTKTNAADEAKYNEFLQLCQHVECMVEQSIAQMDTTSERKSRGGNQRPEVDDLRLRSLRDANRSPSPTKSATPIASTQSHYIWKSSLLESSARTAAGDKYKSQFFPMREPDLVRDDLAVRKLVSRSSGWQPRPKSKEVVVVVKTRPPPHPTPRPRSKSQPAGRLVVRHHSR